METKNCILWTLETFVTPIHSKGIETTDDEEIVNDSLGYSEIKPKCLQREILSVYSMGCWKDSGIRGPSIIGWRRRTGLKTRRLFQGWSKKHVVPLEATLTTSLGIISFVPSQLNVLFFFGLQRVQKNNTEKRRNKHFKHIIQEHFLELITVHFLIIRALWMPAKWVEIEIHKQSSS